MSDKKLTQEYKDRKIELIRRIELCREAKDNIISTVKKLNKNLDHNIISYSEYNKKLDLFLKNKSIEKWIDYYDDSINNYEKELENCESELVIRNNNIKGVITISLILLILGIGIFYLNPSITGYFVANEPTVTVTDGYEIEGNNWADIKGSMFYTSCIKVGSDTDFDDIKISAKIGRTTDNEDLTFAIFNNSEKEEPLSEIGNCIVKDYSNLWKTCTIKDIKLEQSEFWICAYSPSGDRNETYYTIAYSNTDSKKRALFTGKYWQKLEKASYTMKAEFIRW